MAYLLDADVFIRAKNDHYGFDFCPAFWDWLEHANAAGVVHSVEAVYDDLAEWVKDHRTMFLPITADDIPAVAAVNRWANDSPHYEVTAKSEFASAADSFLVGQALAGRRAIPARKVRMFLGAFVEF